MSLHNYVVCHNYIDLLLILYKTSAAILVTRTALLYVWLAVTFAFLHQTLRKKPDSFESFECYWCSPQGKLSCFEVVSSRRGLELSASSSTFAPRIGPMPQKSAWYLWLWQFLWYAYLKFIASLRRSYLEFFEQMKCHSLIHYKQYSALEVRYQLTITSSIMDCACVSWLLFVFHNTLFTNLCDIAASPHTQGRVHHCIQPRYATAIDRRQLHSDQIPLLRNRVTFTLFTNMRSFNIWLQENSYMSYSQLMPIWSTFSWPVSWEYSQTKHLSSPVLKHRHGHSRC